MQPQSEPYVNAAVCPTGHIMQVHACMEGGGREPAPPPSTPRSLSAPTRPHPLAQPPYPANNLHGHLLSPKWISDAPRLHTLRPCLPLARTHQASGTDPPLLPSPPVHSAPHPHLARSCSASTIRSGPRVGSPPPAGGGGMTLRCTSVRCSSSDTGGGAGAGLDPSELEEVAVSAPEVPMEKASGARRRSRSSAESRGGSGGSTAAPRVAGAGWRRPGGGGGGVASGSWG